MKSTTYNKDSWHYRINMSENMLIPLITQRYGWDLTGHYCKQPPIDSCTYWQNILIYFLLQVPIMCFVGLMLTFILVFIPIFSLTVVISTGIILDNLIIIGLILLCLYLIF